MSVLILAAPMVGGLALALAVTLLAGHHTAASPVLALGALLVVLLSLTSLTGDADDLGRAGRAFTQTCATGLTTTVGPWPGIYYSLPIGATMLIGMGAAAVTARAVTRRRRPGSANRVADDQARRVSIRAITGACGVLITAPLAGSALFAGLGLISSACTSGTSSMLGWLAIVVGLSAAVATCWFTAAAVLPHRPMDR